MLVKASLKHLHISPRKTRLVVDLVRGMDVVDAEHQLRFLQKAAAVPILKLLNSAVSNAIHNFEMEKDNLYITKFLINEGPTLKRWRPRAYGRAFTIMKRTCHVELELEEKVKGKKKNKKKMFKKQIKKEVVEAKKTSEGKDLNKPWSKDRDKKKGIFGKGMKGIKNKIFRRKSI